MKALYIFDVASIILTLVKRVFNGTNEELVLGHIFWNNFMCSVKCMLLLIATRGGPLLRLALMCHKSIFGTSTPAPAE